MNKNITLIQNTKRRTQRGLLRAGSILRSLYAALRKLKFKRMIWGMLILLALNLAIMLYSNWRVERYANKNAFNNLSEVPTNKVGLILGTSKYVTDGHINLYFKYRIEAAVALYQAGKIEYIVVSGDNSTKYYNEPKVMREELEKHGIPAQIIYLDYAGFRTLDSVIRCKKIFGQQSFTIISQEFHNKRALYIAGNAEIDAVAYNARDVGFRYGLKVRLRELLARVKVIIDVHITHAQPKFLGDQILIR